MGDGPAAPDVLQSVVSAELAEMLLTDCKGAPSLQLRHELHLLRELLSAEQRTLDALPPEALQEALARLQSAGKLQTKTTNGANPSADAWTEAAAAPVQRSDGETVGGAAVVVVGTTPQPAA
tara:strand:+ start:89 stop:454 length:366 start_codon:yes stop_codon:yes gene_type:complete